MAIAYSKRLPTRPGRSQNSFGNGQMSFRCGKATGANVLIAIFLDESSDNSPRPFPTEQLIAKYGAFLAEAFPSKTENEVRRFFNPESDHFALPMVYEPFVEFRSSWRESSYVNIDTAGFRSVGPDQGPWPADQNSLNVFVYGGSAAFGAVGGQDDESIAAMLQSC